MNETARAALYCCLLWPALAWGQSVAQPASAASDGESSVFDILEEQQQVQLGAAIASKVNESPTSVWIIDRETIERTAAVSVVDLLRLVPGMYVQELGPGYSVVNARFPAIFVDHDMLFMIDGHSILLNAIGFADKHGLPIALDDIERIEVILGPASTLYGSSAVDGVVNIVTRKAPAEGHRLRASMDLGIAAGSSGVPHMPYATPGPLGMAAAEYAQGGPKSGFRLSVNGDFAPSFVTADLNGPQERVAQSRVGGYFTGHGEVGGWELRSDLSAVEHHAGFAIFQLAPLSLTSQIVALSASHKFASGDELTLSGWVGHTDASFVISAQSVGDTKVAFQEDTADVRAQYALHEWFHNRLVVGAELRFFDATSTQFTHSGQVQQVYSLFAEDNFRPLPELSITAGVRVETEEGTGYRPLSHLIASPRASIVWLPSPQHSLRLEFATAYRNPGPLETFMQAYNAAGVPLTIGNPNLRAEQLMAFTLGYLGHFKMLTLRAEAYVSYYTNYINGLTIAATSSQSSVDGIPLTNVSFSGYKLPWIYGNGAPLFFPGALVSLDANLGAGVGGSVFYSFLPAGVEHLAGLNAHWSWNRLRVSGQFYFQSQQDLDFQNTVDAARLILNLFAAYAIDAQRHFELVFAGTNLIDARFFNAPTPGRTRVYVDFSSFERIGPRAWLGLRINFPGEPPR